jgi:hypothetical protein
MKIVTRLAAAFAAVPLIVWTATSAQAAFSITPQANPYPNNGVVYSMAVSGNVVYIGGTFTKIHNPAGGPTATRNHLAAFDATTGALLPWDPDTDGNVRNLTIAPDGTIYAGGSFTQVGGQPETDVVALNPDGSVVSSFNASADNTVRDIVVNGPSIYIAGNFAHVDGVARVGVALLNTSDGSLVKTFNAKVSHGRVRALAYDGTSLFIGGNFTTVNGQPRSSVAAIAPADGSLLPWNPASYCPFRFTCPDIDLTISGTDLIGATGGTAGGWLVDWDIASARTRWIDHSDGDVQVVQADDNGLIYAGGHFGPDFAGFNRHELAVVTQRDGRVQPYTLPVIGEDHPGMWALSVGADSLRIGGATQVSTSLVRRYATFPLA